MTPEFVVLLIAAAQAFLLAILIFQKHRKLYANKFLAFMMLVCGVAVLHMLAQDYGFYENRPHLLIAILGIPFLVAPLHYLYTHYILSRETRFARRDVIHFIPAVAVEILVLALIIFVPRSIHGYIGQNAALVPAPFRIYNWVLLVVGITYVVLSLRSLLKFRKGMKDVVSSLEVVRLNWLMNITLAALALWLVFFVENTFMTFGINISNFIVTTLCGAVYVYAIGYLGLLKSEVFSEPEVEHAMTEVYRASTSDGTGKYAKSGLDRYTGRQIMDRLLKFMDEMKPYTNPTLTIARLAEMLSVSPHNLSEVINSMLGKNFYDFINSYRVELVKKRLSDPGSKDLKILYIALDAGFNSKASFNKIFKEISGSTPSEFRARVAAGAMQK